MTELSKELKREIVSRLKAAGCSPDSMFRLTDLPKDTYNFLSRTSKENGYGKRFSLLVEAAGFVTKTPSMEKLLEMVRDEFRKKFYTKEAIRNYKEEGAPLMEMTEVRRQSELYENFLGRKNRSCTPAQLLDSLYPKECPDLSHYFGGVRAVEAKTPMTHHTGGSLLRKWHFDGENTRSMALLHSRDPLKRAVFYFAEREAKKSKSKEERTVAAQLAKMSRLSKGEFSQLPLFIADTPQMEKAKSIGKISENFARIILWNMNKYDQYGNQQTGEFVKSLPVPVIGVYPNDSNSESRGVRMTYKHPRPDDGKIFADAIVESPDDICVIEVKNTQINSRDIAKRLKDKLLRERAMVWVQGKRDITRKTIVIHSRDDEYKKIHNFLEENAEEFTMISPSEFRKNLDVALRSIEKHGHLMTNVYSRAELMRYFDIFGKSMHLLTRWSRGTEFNFIDETLEKIINSVQSGERHDITKVPDIHLYDGHKERNKYGEFRMFEIPGLGVPYLNTINTLEERLKDLDDDCMILDIGERGRRGHTTYVGTARKEGKELKLEIALAKNPLQEAAILQYLADELKKGRKIVVYGNKFDSRAIQRRLDAHLIQQHLPSELIMLKEGRNAEEAKAVMKKDGAEEYNINDTEAYAHWIETGNPENLNKILMNGMYNLLRASLQYPRDKK